MHQLIEKNVDVEQQHWQLTKDTLEQPLRACAGYSCDYFRQESFEGEDGNLCFKTVSFD